MKNLFSTRAFCASRKRKYSRCFGKCTMQKLVILLHLKHILSKPLLITIVGPTAVGKTAIAIEVAKKLDTMILSGDSRQFYSETNIGTAKPNDNQLAEVPHHFINNLSIHDFYSVGDFERDALVFLAEHFKKQKMAILVGGSGLYIDAVLKGLDDIPEVPESLRQEIMLQMQESGLESLWEELAESDPAYFQTVDKQNSQRVVRAIEVIRHTRKPFSSFHVKKRAERPFDALVIGITADREKLYRQINTRVDDMISSGLIDETKQLYPFRSNYALQTVGYKELFAHFDGEYDLGTAIELIKRNTRRYAKRQLTWFRRDLNTRWFNNDQLEDILAFVREELQKRSLS